MSEALQLLTNSRLRTFRRCARLHFYLYVLCLRALLVAEELRFGDLVHRGLRRWWEAHLPHEQRWQAAMAIEESARAAGRQLRDHELRLVNALDRADALEAALAAVADAGDTFDLVRAETMIEGYHYRWRDERLTPVAVEVQFRAPLMNPMTGAASKTFELAGKLDVLCEREPGRFVIVEHKTTSQNIEAGSEYWRCLQLDSQIGQYFIGARALGYDPVACVYDVLAKPAQRPLRATPPAERQYTQPRWKQCPGCKKKSGAATAPHEYVYEMEDPSATWSARCEDDPDGGPRRVCTDRGGRLYANQRADDETPEQYRARLREAIAAEPARFLARGDVVRLEEDEREHAFNTWMYAALIREATRAERHPMNPEGCRAFGRLCDFFALCTRTSSVDDAGLYRRVADPHVELHGDAA